MNQVWVGRWCVSLSTPSEECQSLAIEITLSSFLVNTNFTLLRSWYLNQIRMMTLLSQTTRMHFFLKPKLIRPQQTGHLM